MKPAVQLSGEDGNVFAIIGRCRRALRKECGEDVAAEFAEKCRNAGSYDEVIQLCMEYCEVY